MTESAGPRVTADVIIELDGAAIVLVRRKNPPLGWALPGGFLDLGESLEQCAVREAREETGLEITLLEQLHTYSTPGRDPRGQTITTVFRATATGQPRGGDDAAEARAFALSSLPRDLAFDHGEILADYLRRLGLPDPQHGC